MFFSQSPEEEEEDAKKKPLNGDSSGVAPFTREGKVTLFPSLSHVRQRDMCVSGEIGLLLPPPILLSHSEILFFLLVPKILISKALVELFPPPFFFFFFSPPKKNSQEKKNPSRLIRLVRVCARRERERGEGEEDKHRPEEWGGEGRREGMF